MTADKTDDLDQLKRIDRAQLYGPFEATVDLVLANLAERGIIYVATCGYRSYAEQDADYAKGRTAPGGKVTQARGGQSPHQFYCAIDFVRHVGEWKGKLNPDWSDEAMRELATEAEAQGLEAGLNWPRFKDAPHIQLPVKSKGLRWADLDAAYRKGGRDAVWALLDSKAPW